jgi:PD-(D/E)XK nuclease superfamily protein
MTQVPHWSATRFTMFDQCPGEFKAHYVDGEAVQLTEAMAFGECVHRGLEAHYRGDDGIRMFRAAWRESTSTLMNIWDTPVDPNLTRMGMDLLEQVFEFGLQGIPERGFVLDTDKAFGAPIVGAIDLWGADGVVYDFKTTKGTWSNERAQKELWQPVLYTMARWEEEPLYEGAFEYIVMNRVTGRVDRFAREWTHEGIIARWNIAWERMREISEAVREDRYECHGKHGFCPECGDRWSHGHVCGVSKSTRIRLHA